MSQVGTYLNFDLVFQRKTSLTPEQLWQGWTDPEILMKWFCPRPWKVTECKMDLKPGGQFYTVMQGPAGERVPGNGCILEVIPNQKFVWTNMMGPDFRPTALQSSVDFPFVSKISFTRSGHETLYHAIVSHADEAGMKRHEQMGFQEGWGMAFQQLVDLYTK